MIEDSPHTRGLRTAFAAVATAVEGELRRAGHSFRTKIHTSRKRGREFLVLLLG